MDDQQKHQMNLDHDLLIRLDEKVTALVKSVSLLTDDHEKRIRRLERICYGGLAILSGIQFYFNMA